MISSDGAALGARAAETLRKLGRSEIGPGLTNAEFDHVETDHSIEFADDHRAFLAAGLPLNAPPEPGQTWRRPWPDWRNGDPQRLREQLGWPVEGTLFDVEHNGIWHDTWGPRPGELTEALAIAREHLAQEPTLIPVYGHRYLPGGHGTYGHPVLSIYQTDIIFYGTDLVDYITNEFSGSGWFISEDWTPPPLVRFWSDFL